MTVIFQDKIIYMPYMPPFARSEKVEDYVQDCRPVEWQALSIRSLDRTKISLCIGRLSHEDASPINKTRRLVICYFQGNGSSLPPRLPLLSNVLKAIALEQGPAAAAQVDVTLVALSYRGYWTSSGRASEVGIRMDSQAMLAWVRQTYGHDAEIVLWGQSIGAGVACAAAAELATSQSELGLSGLILETPFTSIKSMLIALYPQKWLPYQYLWPFLWNHWDNAVALHQIANKQKTPRVLLLTSRRDEVVPPEEATRIEQILKQLNFASERVDIFGALHTEATTRREGQQAVADFIQQLIERGR